MAVKVWAMTIEAIPNQPLPRVQRNLIQIEGRMIARVIKGVRKVIVPRRDIEVVDGNWIGVRQDYAFTARSSIELPSGSEKKQMRTSLKSSGAD